MITWCQFWRFSENHITHLLFRSDSYIFNALSFEFILRSNGSFVCLLFVSQRVLLFRLKITMEKFLFPNHNFLCNHAIRNSRTTWPNRSKRSVDIWDVRFYLSELSFSFDGRTTFDGFNLTGSFNFHLESYFFVLSYILTIILMYL